MAGRALINGCRRSSLCSAYNRYSVIESLSSNYTTSNTPARQPPKKPQLSPYNSNIVRLLNKEIGYQIEYAPPHEPVTEFEQFTVEDRPGEQWITLRGKSTEDENIKIEATMFDGLVDDIGGDGESVPRPHISVLVDVWRGERGGDKMEFVCSAWPSQLEIQKVYVFGGEEMVGVPYMGPDVRSLKLELRSGIYEFLRRRGLGDGLSVFLHEYMMNKGRIEFVMWLKRVRSYIGIR